MGTTQAIPSRHDERHRVERIGWLRAAVLGANDGIVSTASLIVGVAAAASSQHEIMLAGAAGLAAGAFSMAAGEYVSVSSQADTENAELDRERGELATMPDYELGELAAVYERRGLKPALAWDVARAMTEHDALAAHARDELSITELTTARPLQAAIVSALTFSAGAALPLGVAAVAPVASLGWTVSGSALPFLGLLGALGARAGGAPVGRAVVRVTFWGALALGVTALVGSFFA